MARTTRRGLDDTTDEQARRHPARGEDVPPSLPLPAGIVTFVMTDIEGSTKLFRTLGHEYADVLADHHRLLRAAFGARRGVEVGTEGDSLLFAFPDAAGALAACIAGQLTLAAHPWPPQAEIRVRIGVHTGEATPVDGDYVALALHQVARICAGAHGGQVVVSEATASQVEGRLSPRAMLDGLGSYQLRGFTAPVQLFQLRHPDLRAEFPPLRLIGVVAHNLPFIRASFVGRSEERSALADVIRGGGLVSVVGVGGVGKTRLAIQVAFDVMDDFPDGAWMVELAAVTDTDAIPRAVASALGVAEEPGQGIDRLVIESLRPKAALLLLDNCEHLLHAVADFAERLSQACPRLVILATSREPLDIDGEVVWRVEPFPVVDAARVTRADEAAQGDAVQLFVQRARQVQPGFHLTDENAGDVAGVVTHLSGIPLAIELAAAAMGERSLAGVLQGLDDRFALLSHGRRTAPDRHQTLRAALQWSLDLLPPPERRLFARLGVFAGGGTIEAAAAVCGGGDVTAAEVPGMMRHLVRASLLTSRPETHQRWSMLESIRELASLEMDATGEREDLERRHREWYEFWIDGVSSDLGRRGHGGIMGELAADQDNVRRAIDHAVATGDARSALRICVGMAPYWTSHGDWTEGSRRLDTALGLAGGDDRLRGRARVALGNLLLLRGDLAEAEARFVAGRREAEATDDDVTVARAFAGLGYVAFRHSQLDVARSRWERALARAEPAGDERVTAGILRSLAIAAGSSGRQAETQALLDRAIAAAERAEDDQLLRLLLGSSAEMHLWLGHYDRAESAYGDALALATEIGDLSARPLLLAELGWVALLRGAPGTAERLSIEAAELAEDLGNPRLLAHALRLQGEAMARRGTLTEAGVALEHAARVAEGLGAPAELAGVRCSQACLALDLQQRDEARRLAEEAMSLSSLGHPMRRTSPAWVLGVVAAITGEPDAAKQHFGRGMREAVFAHIPRHEANAHWGLAVADAAAGNVAGAVAAHRRSWELRRAIGDRLGLVDSLIGLATVTAPAAPGDAARLVGAAIEGRSAAGATATPFEAAQLAAARDALASHGDPGLVAEAERRGAAMDEASIAAIVERLAGTMESDGTESPRRPSAGGAVERQGGT